MTDRAVILTGRSVTATSWLIAVASIIVVVSLGSPVRGPVILLAMWALGIGLVAWATIRAQPRNGVAWAFVASSAFASLAAASGALFTVLVPESIRNLSDAELLATSPSQLPPEATLAINPYLWAWAPAFFLVLTVVLLLFPDGSLLSPRWRWLLWLSFVSIALGVVPSLLAGLDTSSTLRFDFSNAEEVLTGTAEIVVAMVYSAWIISVPVVIVGSVVALLVRYRKSSGATRHQIRWILWAGAVLGVVMLFVIVESDTALVETRDLVSIVLLGGAELLVVGSFWVAITKYRLYDIDIVISKTVTYSALAVFITTTYVAIVVGLGSLVGAGDEPNLALAIGATAVVALLFQPVRSWVQHWANRLVYGTRATPYETLARFSKRAATAESDEEVLERIPRLIVDGTGATQATLWTTTNGELQPAATWPEGETPGDADYSVPVEHRGEVLGAITMSSGRGEAIAPAEEELVQNLAGGLGLALRNARLTDDLRAQVDELAASRERILSAADEARRGLERDLDMGPQQELVAVKVKLGVVKTKAHSQNAVKTAEVLKQLEADTGAAIESVRDFARGVYPPLLEADGLAAAVSAEGAKAAFPVTIEADGVGRYPREIETAVFFSILESLQNAAKYSGASSVAVRLEDDGERLTFSVADDGTGFDPKTVEAGSGLPGMADRLDAAGGTLGVESAPGQGTVVSGSVPI